MKNRVSAGGGEHSGGSNLAVTQKNLKRNKRRLGGGGLSLETFANLKSKSNGYNPAIIKKQREFYKNAKYVNKYRRAVKNEDLPDDLPLKIEPLEDDVRTEENTETTVRKRSKKSNHKPFKLNELYELKRQEVEKARMEREAIIQAKEQARNEAVSHRKSERKKMFKKTRNGQPLMKYRIENLLETIQGSAKK